MRRAADACDPRLKKCFGTLAWGRFDGEPCASDSKDNTIFGCGFLEGMRYALLCTAQEFKLEGEDALRRIHKVIDEQERKSA